jgi:hypothetical protein
VGDSTFWLSKPAHLGHPYLAEASELAPVHHRESPKVRLPGHQRADPSVLLDKQCKGTKKNASFSFVHQGLLITWIAHYMDCQLQGLLITGIADYMDCQLQGLLITGIADYRDC